jgi:hypothetical protein
MQRAMALFGIRRAHLIWGSHLNIHSLQQQFASRVRRGGQAPFWANRFIKKTEDFHEGSIVRMEVAGLLVEML